MSGAILWQPPVDARSTTRIGAYLEWLKRHRSLTFNDYGQLWSWSVEDIEGFWSSTWEFFRVQAHSQPTAVLTSHEMPGARWFPDATLNYAEHALADRSARAAILSFSQTRSAV